jgi:HEAT repeat protein
VPAKTTSLDKVLAKTATYDYGQSREPLTQLTAVINDASDSPRELNQIEKRLLEVLDSDATLACKQFICRKLSIIGTEEAVPMLAKMLVEPQTSDMARYALERIPGSAVNRALQRALDYTSGKVKVGIINSLGERRDKEAVEKLGRLLMSGVDKDIALAGLSALGKIGGVEAAKALGRVKVKMGGELHVPWVDASLMCAERFLAEGNTRWAMRIYRRLYVPAEPVQIRIAALRGIITAEPRRGAAFVIDALKYAKPEVKTLVIGLLREIPGTGVTKAVAAELPNLSVAGQVQLLSALADRGDRSALPAVINATKSPEAGVRAAAFTAIGVLGDASTVDLLAEMAATVTGPEREAARESLYRLRDPGTDSKILASIPKADSKVKVELIRSIGERNIVTAVGTLFKTAKDPKAKVRLESFRVLRVIAGQKELPALIQLLINVRGEAERKQAERCVAVVARGIVDKGRRAEAILAALPSVKDIKSRCSLLSVLGKIGDNSALPALRRALKDEDAKVREAAVRALADWPSAEPAEILLELATTAPTQRSHAWTWARETHRVLALRGYIRMAGLPSDRPAGQTLKMYKAAMEAARRPEEKKLVLARIPELKTIEALKFVEPYLEEQAVREEAQVAYMAIAVAIKEEHEREANAALDKIRRLGDSGPAVVSVEKPILLKPLKAILTPPMELTTDEDGVLHIVVSGEGQRLEEPGKGGRAIYSFNTSQKGTLHLDFYIDGASNNDDSWHVKLDGNPYFKWNDNITKGWEWREFPQEYPVEKGKHILIIDQREDGAKISEIRLKLKELQ